MVERGAVERGAVERGAVERGAVERGAVERGAVERGAVEGRTWGWVGVRVRGWTIGGAGWKAAGMMRT
jgi:hypothetical protein